MKLQDSEPDQRVTLRYVDRKGIEALLAVRGDRTPPRVAYLDGVVELMSPGRPHEFIRFHFDALLTVYFGALGIKNFTGAGQWLIEVEEDVGIEPDNCFLFGPEPNKKDRPDLAIEVVYTSGGIDRLEIYRRIGVPEVWFWIEHEIHVYVLGSSGYHRQKTSLHVPEIDFRLLLDCLDQEQTSDAVQKLMAELTARRS